MKAALFHTHGPIENLEIADVPQPEAGSGEVLLRVRAVALNHLDLFVREGIPGLRLPLPHIGGSDIAGEIAAPAWPAGVWATTSSIPACGAAGVSGA